MKNIIITSSKKKVKDSEKYRNKENGLHSLLPKAWWKNHVFKTVLKNSRGRRYMDLRGNLNLDRNLAHTEVLWLTYLSRYNTYVAISHCSSNDTIIFISIQMLVLEQSSIIQHSLQKNKEHF